VYCLGQCDRAPAVRVDGFIRTPDEGRTSIRSLTDTPIVTVRLGNAACPTLALAQAAGVFEALADALDAPGAVVLEAVEASNLRGRGGAGFPAGRKWRTAADTQAAHRVVVVNGDEGDPGSFIDRLLLQDDPFGVIEGLLLAGYAIGADRGILYVRNEYPEAVQVLNAAVDEAREAGFIGDRILGTGFCFEIEVITGKGSYVCGEETALINAIEHRRGEVRLRPPYPAVAGLDGYPTVVNNVETLINVPWIVRHGAAAYRALGTPESAGTLALCFDAGFAHPGVVEVAFGTDLKALIEVAAGGGVDGPLEAVVIGGPMGTILGPDAWSVPVCYAAMDALDIRLGHGGLVAVPAGTDWQQMLRHWLTFMVQESCGRCSPCALGSQAALGAVRSPEALESLLKLMETASLCAFGRSMPAPLRQIVARMTASRPQDAGQEVER
jgi:NADH:ubiquinone oxidoreductase subunit F (NADH-binding)